MAIFCIGRPSLRGDLCMTYGTPQNGPQASCLPIGVGLSYDELTLLSCDVHRNGQNVRLFDIQTGRLKHTISSNQVPRKKRIFNGDILLRYFLVSK
jgi:hypothetical protein